jgi:hypothetical protein
VGLIGSVAARVPSIKNETIADFALDAVGKPIAGSRKVSFDVAPGLAFAGVEDGGEKPAENAATRRSFDRSGLAAGRDSALKFVGVGYIRHGQSPIVAGSSELNKPHSCGGRSSRFL